MGLGPSIQPTTPAAVYDASRTAAAKTTFEVSQSLARGEDFFCQTLILRLCVKNARTGIIE